MRNIPNWRVLMGASVVLVAMSCPAGVTVANWQTLFTTNPTAMPVSFADTNRSDSARFYRLQLGP